MIADEADPVRMTGPGVRAGLTVANHPVDSWGIDWLVPSLARHRAAKVIPPVIVFAPVQIERTERGFVRDKSDGGGRPEKLFDPSAERVVFDADAEPDVWERVFRWVAAEVTGEKIREALIAFLDVGDQREALRH